MKLAPGQLASANASNGINMAGAKSSSATKPTGLKVLQYILDPYPSCSKKFYNTIQASKAKQAKQAERY